LARLAGDVLAAVEGVGDGFRAPLQASQPGVFLARKEGVALVARNLSKESNTVNDMWLINQFLPK
jgi:hypothetical protein